MLHECPYCGTRPNLMVYLQIYRCNNCGTQYCYKCADDDCPRCGKHDRHKSEQAHNS